MRQSTAVKAIVAGAVVVAAALVVFGLGRSWWWHDGHPEGPGDHHAASHPGGSAQHREEGAGGHARDVDMSPSGELVDGVRVVEVAARKFEFDPATIVVREGERVRLKVTSKDVTHGIGIEAYNIDRKLEPGRSETIEFTADKAGRHHFYCTVYCGSGHGDMHGLLVVLDRTQ